MTKDLSKGCLLQQVLGLPEGLSGAFYGSDFHFSADLLLFRELLRDLEAESAQ